MPDPRQPPRHVGLVVLDMPGWAEPIPALSAFAGQISSTRQGSDALAMEAPAHALRRQAGRLVELVGPIFGILAPLVGHRLSHGTLVTLAIDRVAGLLRRAVRLREICADAGIARLRLAHPAALPASVLRFLAVGGLTAAAGDGIALELPPLQFRIRAQFATLARPPLAEALAQATSPQVDVFVTAAHSDLYLLSILPVLRRTLAVRPAMVVLPGAIDPSDFAARHGLAEAMQQGRLHVLVRPAASPAMLTVQPEEATRRLTEALAGYVAEAEDPMGASLRGLLAEGVAGRLLPLLHFAAALQAEAAPLLPRVAAVTVAPGRLAEAAALVDLANACGVPSHEIQAGPVSALRALPPNARRIFCMDAISARTYVEDLGVPPEQLVLSGSPRIQELVGPWRGVTRARARVLLGRFAKLHRPRLVMLATQPVGVDLCRRILAITLEACRDAPGIQLLVRAHPGEDESYLASYRALLEGEKAACLMPAAASPYLMLRACDLLVTYASTLGREAAEIGTPVVVVNPLDRRPAYDLALGGIATEVADASALGALLRTPPPPASRPGGIDSVGRIATAILSAGRGVV